MKLILKLKLKTLEETHVRMHLLLKLLFHYLNLLILASVHVEMVNGCIFKAPFIFLHDRHLVLMALLSSL